MCAFRVSEPDPDDGPGGFPLLRANVSPRGLARAPRRAGVPVVALLPDTPATARRPRRGARLIVARMFEAIGRASAQAPLADLVVEAFIPNGDHTQR